KKTALPRVCTSAQDVCVAVTLSALNHSAKFKTPLWASFFICFTLLRKTCNLHRCVIQLSATPHQPIYAISLYHVTFDLLFAISALVALFARNI
ncbi:MAG: hypothetical protein ACI4MI_00500, partial [Christensenellales bacterium]